MDERSIFLNALDKNEPQERAKYLQEACGENQRLRRQVEELLRASRDAGEFLESPPPALVATIASGAFDAAPDTQDEASLDFL
ncbi:MAG: hypothetical protein KY475_20715, partial [Planctomycetes bacterium]|nr:hypothetical protein [Planctomycetota bacterium]